MDAFAVQKHFVTSGKSLAHLHHPYIWQAARGASQQRGLVVCPHPGDDKHSTSVRAAFA
jgi:hypothetical protein